MSTKQHRLILHLLAYLDAKERPYWEVAMVTRCIRAVIEGVRTCDV